LTRSSSHLPNPLSQFLQIAYVHSEYKFLSMDVMNSENMILVEDDLVTLLQPVQPSFNKRIIHEATEVVFRTLCDLHPEVFAPAS